MAKRKMLAMIIALVMCVSLVACSGGKPNSDVEIQSNADEEVKSKLGMFIVIEVEAIDGNLYQFIMYDPNTMVMYSFLDGESAGGLTVMYNADGTLRLYSSEY